MIYLEVLMTTYSGFFRRSFIAILTVATIFYLVVELGRRIDNEYRHREQRIDHYRNSSDIEILDAVSLVTSTTLPGDPLACVDPDCIPTKYWDGERFYALPETQ